MLSYSIKTKSKQTLFSQEKQNTGEDLKFCHRVKMKSFRLQGLWQEYYSSNKSFIIVESDEVYRIDSDNYHIREWVNVGQLPDFGWREYCYSPDMSKLRHHLTFKLLYVHQVRMHYVFQDTSLKVYYIFRGIFTGPIQAYYPVTFFADRSDYGGWALSLENSEVMGIHNSIGEQTRSPLSLKKTLKVSSLLNCLLSTMMHLLPHHPNQYSLHFRFR